jgi:hypothetical protein
MKKRNLYTAKTKGYNFTPYQLAQITLADAECDNPNNLVTHEEAIFHIEKWLKRSIQSKIILDSMS